MKIRKNIAISETGFIFNPLTGDSFSVNPVGVFILQKLKEGQDAETMLKTISKEYDMDTYTAEKDLNDFLASLKSYQLTENE